MITLSPQHKTVFQKVLARCNDNQPYLDFLRELGVDVQDRQDRIDLQRQQAETALRLAGVNGLGVKQ